MTPQAMASGDHAPRVSVLSWSDDRRLRVWSLPTGERRPPRGHADSVHGALVLRDGRALSWSRDATPVNA